MLTPYLSTDLCSHDSFTFINKEIHKVSLKDEFFVSFDITSLFTNIPLNETIDIVINLLFENKSNLEITRSELRKLFMIATSQTHFLFNGNYYDKVDGVAMGSPLTQVLAYWFMGFHEERWLEKYSGTCPYIICVFNDENEATLFFDYLNKQHKNIKFTIELENYGKLAFLNVFIDLIILHLLLVFFINQCTQVFLLIFLSFTSFTYKVGLIRCLIDRVYKINNTVFGFNRDMEKLTEILNKNLFPSRLIKG